MLFDNLLKRIKMEISDKNIAYNYAKALLNVPQEFIPTLEAWVSGEEPNFSFKGITLEQIMLKEHCTYLKALLRMQILLNNPELTDGYPKWNPINKDCGR